MISIYETHLYKIDGLDLRAEAEEFFESEELIRKSIKVSRSINDEYQDLVSQRFTVPKGVLVGVSRLCETAISQYVQFANRDASNHDSILDVSELLLLDSNKVWRVDLYEVKNF